MKAGGLAIIGTERHESRRIDNQLRGRAGRQGDPGSSRFYISLEDDLMRLFGSERISSVVEKIGLEEDMPIEHKMLTKSIASEIEEVVAQNEMIKECACIPIPDEITGEAPKLFIVINEGFEYDEKSLHRFMLEKLEAIKVPKVVQVIDALPRTFNGKVIKRMLKEM